MTQKRKHASQIMITRIEYRTIVSVNKSWQFLERVKGFGGRGNFAYLCGKKMEGNSFSRNVWMVAKAIVDAKMSFYHWIIRRDITGAKDWKARSVIRGLVPYRECRFNELTEDDLGSLMIIFKRKDQKTETHLLSDDEVDELAVLLGINLYSAEDHRIFITDVTRMMIEGAEYLTMEKN